MANQFAVDFIGIGSGKSGSTWLYKNIIKHPEICDLNPKEINYFSSLYKTQDLDWYRGQFSKCGNLTKGEFSVNYMSTPGTELRIHTVLPDVKLLAILRKPQNRIFSDYCHSIRKGDVPANRSFKEYIKDEHNLSYGVYHIQLAPYYALFPASQIKVILFEQATNNPEQTLSEIYRWLGLKDVAFLPEGLQKKVNESKSYRWMWIENVMTRTSRFLNGRGYTLLVERLKRAGVADIIRRFNQDDGSLQVMDTESEVFLQKYFEPHNDTLSAMIGRNLNEWW